MINTSNIKEADTEAIKLIKAQDWQNPRLWQLVYNCCKNVATRKLRDAPYLDVFEERVQETTLRTMESMVLKGQRPKGTLSSFCYWKVLEVFYGKDAKRWDTESSYPSLEELKEEGYEPSDEEVRMRI